MLLLKITGVRILTTIVNYFDVQMVEYDPGRRQPGFHSTSAHFERKVKMDAVTGGGKKVSSYSVSVELGL